MNADNFEKKMQEFNIEKSLENLYLISFAIFLSYYFLGTTMFTITWPDNFWNKMMTVMIALVVAKTCANKSAETKEVVMTLLITGSLYYIWKKSGYTEIYLLLIMIIGAKDIPEKKLIRVYFWVQVVLLAYTTISAVMGNVENLIYYQGERRRRIAMGIVYPTDFSAHVFYISLAYTFIRREKIKWGDIALLSFVGCLAYYLSDARMNFLCSICLVVGLSVYLILKKIKIPFMNNLKEFFSWFMALCPAICALGMITLTVFYKSENKIWEKLNSLFNNRLSQGKLGVELYGFSDWGQYIKMVGNGSTTSNNGYYFFLDSSYVNIILRMGMVAFVATLIIMLLISCDARRRRDWIFLGIMAMVSVQCVVEHHLLEVAYNPFMWLLLCKKIDTDYKDVVMEKDKGFIREYDEKVFESAE